MTCWSIHVPCVPILSSVIHNIGPFHSRGSLLPPRTYPLSPASPPQLFSATRCVYGSTIHCPFSTSFPLFRTRGIHAGPQLELPTPLMNIFTTTHAVYWYIASIFFPMFISVRHSPFHLINVRLEPVWSANLFRISPGSRHTSLTSHLISSQYCIVFPFLTIQRSMFTPWIHPVQSLHPLSLY